MISNKDVLLSKGIQFMKKHFNLTPLGTIKDDIGRFATVFIDKEKKQKYIMSCVGYVLNIKGKGLSKSLTKETIDYAVQNKARYLLFIDKLNGKINIMELDAQSIFKECSDAMDEYRSMQRYDLVPLNKYFIKTWEYD